jgi:hypothetical protein
LVTSLLVLQAEQTTNRRVHHADKSEMRTSANLNDFKEAKANFFVILKNI